MIRSPTVLILGAGASAPFDFPSGYGLVTFVLRQLGQPDSPLYQSLRSCGHTDERLVTFRQALNDSRRPSIDAFVEGRPEFADIGKGAIAAGLIPTERGEMLFREGTTSWYDYLLGHLGTKPEDLPKNRLAIITFNDDRSLEYFLWRALRGAYGLKEDEAAALVTEIPIVHVHGQLDALAPLEGTGRLYSPEVSPHIPYHRALRCRNSASS